MSYKRLNLSCLLCKRIISSKQITNHYNTDACKSPICQTTEKCKHCDLDKSEIIGDFANHVRWCTYKNSSKIIQKKCTRCDCIFDTEKSKRRTTCSLECSRTHSDKTKQIISEKRKSFLFSNPDKHPWKNNSKFISVPCEKFKDTLKELGYDFKEEWQPLSDRLFSIDIAFTEKKIGIEINGNQHYNSDGTLKSYYQERHDLICSSGWKLIEIHYSQCFDKENIVKIISSEESLKWCAVPESN